MSKSYSSVPEMLRDMGLEDIAQDVEMRSNARKLAHWLCLMRITSDLSQRQMAKRLGLKTKQVRRIEESEGVNITVGDLMRYAAAFQVSFTLPWRAECTCPTLGGIKVTGSSCPKHGLKECDWL